MTQHFNKNTPYRYERKFTATAAHRSDFIVQIKKHPAFFKAEDGIRDLVRSRGLGDVYKRQPHILLLLQH